MNLKNALRAALLLALSFGPMAAGTVNLPASGDLQAALNAAQPGDTIYLTAGATYTGNFLLPAAKPGAGVDNPITITTAQPAQPMPTVGRFAPTGTAAPLVAPVVPVVSPSQAKIVSPNTAAAISVTTGVNGWTFTNVEMTVAPGVFTFNIVDLGSPKTADPSTYARNVTFDRVYIHGDPAVGGKRGIAMNAINVTVKNSYVSDFSSSSSGDCQALADWFGPGPFTITNNFLSGGQGIIFGGAAPLFPGIVPSNIVVTGNLFSRPMAWKGVREVKNQFELKNAQNVVVSGNVFENNWTSAQNGYIVLFTVRTCEAGNYFWSVVQNVSFTYNIVRNSDNGINVLGTDNVRGGCANTPPVAGLSNGILIQNNLLTGINGEFLQLLSGAQHVTVDHNTAMQKGTIAGLDGTPSGAFRFTNNISMFGPYGVVGNGTIGALTTFAKFAPDAVFMGNVAISPAAGRTNEYPAGNFFPATTDLVGFTDFANGQYQLLTTSPYHNAGTDGKDIGADISGVLSATAPALSGLQ